MNLPDYDRLSPSSGEWLVAKLPDGVVKWMVGTRGLNAELFGSGVGELSSVVIGYLLQEQLRRPESSVTCEAFHQHRPFACVNSPKSSVTCEAFHPVIGHRGFGSR
ncbi:hypothetical protein CEXT_782401 [Caerostris extrusa]|uniref:Uncharacterized protein n=1 Tax=Caerostris extrusa TaxID=172846 RepID=A0AAV4MKU8_CAEEX|nr:hypothetical protein CEXT_782401 [Caerostris extrusa]